ncbi:class I SAM-dependent methyltransferase [Sphaerothrix gracilis]|uniref:class I SAM-dependent methyltransferase n=1 Tax=Sphaerothrix gracilis TaxID=3151835 RepID=UPI0031FBAC5D
MTFLYPQTRHPLIPQAHAPQADQLFANQIKEFRQTLFGTLQSKIKALSEKFAQAENQEISYPHLRQELDRSAEIQAVHHQRGVLQDRLWQQVADEIEKDRDRLAAAFATYSQPQDTLELDPNLEIPAHQLKANIHRMPGGYLQDGGDADFWTGALYDHGVFLYGQGWLGSLNDELGHTVIHHVLAEHYPQLKPHKILDMGCSVGHSTLPYVSAYPEAEIWAIDLSASLLRYAHARAHALGKTVHFSQQNAENTKFATNSFDLVVSHILMHEIPCGARKKVFAESYRLLEAGGVMVHLDSKLFLSPPTPMARYFRDTEVWANSEPYLGSSRFEDFERYALEAGFKPENFKIHSVPGYYAAQQGSENAGWAAFCAVK